MHIYVHIPFCRTFCRYCSFYSVKGLGSRDDYVKAVIKEAESRSRFFDTPADKTEKGCHTLYIGGGTPSCLTVAQLTAGVDVGTKLDYTYDMTGGLMFRPEFGLHFPMRQKVGMKLTLLYERYSCKTTVMNAEVKYKLNQIGIKLGVSF